MLIPRLIPLLNLDLRDPQRHLIRARLCFEPRQRRVELRLPSWTPGSYLIRDYVRTLEGLQVWQGSRLLETQRLAPATWLLRLEEEGPLEVRYALHAMELSVRTCHLNSDHGVLALAGVALEIDGERVSSTRIRQMLEAGDFAQAENLLGKPYSISGRIAYGQQLGRKLGVPTANVHLRRYRSPLHGVFTVTVKFVDGSVHQGVANVGVRPTVTGDKKPLLEVHLFNFSRKVYGVMIDVIFHTKLRDEKKFNSLDELQTQLQMDIAQAQHFFSHFPV